LDSIPFFHVEILTLSAFFSLLREVGVGVVGVVVEIEDEGAFFGDSIGAVFAVGLFGVET
jgi:hypothetical protein